MNRRTFLTLLGLAAGIPGASAAKLFAPKSRVKENYQAIGIGWEAAYTLELIREQLAAFDCGNYLYCAGSLSRRSTHWLNNTLIEKQPKSIIVVAYLHEPRIPDFLPSVLQGLRSLPQNPEVSVHTILPTSKDEWSIDLHTWRSIEFLRESGLWNRMRISKHDEYNDLLEPSDRISQIRRGVGKQVMDDLVDHIAVDGLAI